MRSVWVGLIVVSIMFGFTMGIVFTKEGRLHGWVAPMDAERCR
jgi:hypothetical protein